MSTRMILILLIIPLIITTLIAMSSGTTPLTSQKSAAISHEANCLSLYQKVGQAFCARMPLAKKGLVYLHDLIPEETIMDLNLRLQIKNFLHSLSNHSPETQTIPKQQTSNQCAAQMHLKSAMEMFLTSEKKLFAAHDTYVSLLNNAQPYADDDAHDIIKNFKNAWLELKQKIALLNITLTAVGIDDTAFDLNRHYSDVQGSLFLHNE